MNFEPIGVILKQPVADNAGRLVGSVEELLLDLHDGRIEYVKIKLALDGDAESHRYVVVPWSALARQHRAGTPWRVLAGREMLERLAQN